MSHNEFQSSEPIEPQEASPFHYDRFINDTAASYTIPSVGTSQVL